MVLPTFASVPLLAIYSGATEVVVPVILRPYLGNTLELSNSTYYNKVNDFLAITGYLYYVYLGMLAIFCTNAINIYAGLNGLEVGQSIIIGCAVLIHNAAVRNPLLRCA